MNGLESQTEVFDLLLSENGGPQKVHPLRKQTGPAPGDLLGGDQHVHICPDLHYFGPMMAAQCPSHLSRL